jgi:sec-independent protein translocase protein TatA
MNMSVLGFIGMPGQFELIIFLLIILVFFGKRLPSAMYSVGKSITEFKKGVSEDSHADDEPESRETLEKDPPARSKAD